MKQILLIVIGLSSLIYADFSRSTAGVVTDSVTHLQWQDGYSDNSDTIKISSWLDAIAYCEGLSLDGEEWRLPNKNELLSILDYGVHNPAISSVFVERAPNYYWSSTTYWEYTYNAWVVNFGNGNTFYWGKTSLYTVRVRCVRAVR